MLSNAYLLAKIGADTAENEQHFAENLPIGRRVAGRRGGAYSPGGRGARRGARRARDGRAARRAAASNHLHRFPQINEHQSHVFLSFVFPFSR